MAQWHNPTRRPLRALLSRYLAAAGRYERRQARPRCRRHRLGGHAPLVGVGVRKAVGRAGPPQDGPKLGAVHAPLGGLIIISTSSRSEDVRRGETPFPYENSLFNGSEVDP